MSKAKVRAILQTFLIVFLWATIVFCSVLLSNYYPEVYNTPRNDGARMDFSGYSLAGNSISSNTVGEWEFFYNKWLITDGLTDEQPDLMLSMPGPWTDKKTASGERLGRSGYGSYRMTVSGLEAGTTIWLYRHLTNVAWRGYADGKQIQTVGTMGRTKTGTFAGAQTRTTGYKINAEQYTGSVVIVIEVGYNDSGGLVYPPWVRTSQQETSPVISSLINSLPLIMIGVLFAMVVFNIVISIGVYKRDKNLSLIVFLFIIVIHFLTTKDVYINLAGFFPGISYLTVYHLNVVTAAAAMIAFVAMIALSKTLRINLREIIALCGVSAAALTLYIGLWGRALHFLCIVPFLGYLIYILYRLFSAPKEPGKFRKSYAMLMFGLVGIILLESLETFALVCFGVDGVISVALSVFIIGMCVLNYFKVQKTTADALKVADYENEVNRIKQNALKSQIKPHFVFNSLTSIQALFHESLDKGDAGLERFARHLRVNIDSNDRDLISFEEELQNILNYVELEDMRREKRTPLLLDIETTDFMVPVLSLQPLIENAIKYSGVSSKDGGYIQIKTYRQREWTVIEIVDNGVGFDPASARLGAAGLKNVRDRFRYLLFADFKIESAPSLGCTVKIIIKRGGES